VKESPVEILKAIIEAVREWSEEEGIEGVSILVLGGEDVGTIQNEQDGDSGLSRRDDNGVVG